MKLKIIILLCGIVLLAAVLRFWGLGQTPISPDWDEVSLGYNAYSILHTGHDEYGRYLPVVLESFGDYKPALYSYLSIPSVALFGLTVFAVRFPSAIFGIITVLGTFFLLDELFKDKRISILGSFLLSISPWSIQFSRIAFEANVGLGFNVLSILFFLKGLKRPWFLSLSCICMALNMYVYQSEKVFTPLIAVTLILIYKKELFILKKRYLLTALGFGIAVVLPMLVFIIQNPQAFSRAEGVSIFSEQTQLLQTDEKDLAVDTKTHNYIGELFYNRRVVYTKEIISNYLSHYNLNWLFITGDLTRAHAPQMGLLYLWELPFVGMGIYFLLFSKYPTKTKWLVFSWFLLGPLPAAVTTGTPSAVRVINMLPTFQVFTSLGLINSFLYFQNTNTKQEVKILKIPLIVIFLCFSIFNFIYFLNQYFAQTNYFTAQDWQYGYEPMVNYVLPIHNKYQQVIVSDTQDFAQSYMFFLFYLHYNPNTYIQNGGTQPPGGPQRFSNFVFRQFHYSNEHLRDVLYIGEPSNFPTHVKAIYKVYYLNGNLAMEAVPSK